MPWGLARFHHSGQSHFVTFCCYHRRRLFTTDASRRIFESALERVRRSYRLRVYGYVVMPEHVHLLLSEPQMGTAPLKPKTSLNGPPLLLGEPEQDTLADALKSLKQGVSRRLIGDSDHFWQKRYYDFNIRNYAQFVEKLRYVHRNPVTAGLCERPEDWEWSSFRHYATACEGRVEIESEWTARKRERAAGRLCPVVEGPTQAKSGLEWATRQIRRIVNIATRANPSERYPSATEFISKLNQVDVPNWRSTTDSEFVADNWNGWDWSVAITTTDVVVRKARPGTTKFRRVPGRELSSLADAFSFVEGQK